MVKQNTDERNLGFQLGSKFEVTDEKGDAKKMYAGMKTLNGSNTYFARFRVLATPRASAHRREEKVTENETQM